ncbi:MAG TPA: histidine phosphatase family protein [Acetobacteraceae bacterium]|nr:histidine phosphatase family protein [Acetobacteraceae bacterium]
MILLRHGQSEFNVHFSATRRDPGIVDPVLTPLGVQQAEAAARALAGHDLRRILASPYTRALQTATIVGRMLDLPVLVNPIVRERFAFVCDIGTPRTELAPSWPEQDFSHIDEIWWPAMQEPEEQVIERAALFRDEMRALHDWSETLVVSHWGFILALTGRSMGNCEWLRYDPTLPAPEEIVWQHH